MNINITITPPSNFINSDSAISNCKLTIKKNKSNKKSRFYKRPWFWVLFICIASFLIHFTLKKEEKMLTESFNDETPTPKKIVKSENQFPDSNSFKATEISATEKVNKALNNSKKAFHFILNTTTKTYHTGICRAVKKLADRKKKETDIEANSIEEAKDIIEKQGYTLCGICNK